jgi:asparagine synthase (glutamine-hydrolysing)
MPREAAERQLLKMVGMMCHEDFYVAGTWIQESLGVYVGWVARRNSFADGMPARNEGGDVVLVFAGEEFPEPGTQARLKEQGHEFVATGPSYLVHLYEQEPSFPAGLNGRFHGLLADLRKGTTTLFNDRFGMQRLYFHEAKDGFYFAAEAKAILGVRPELRQLDQRSLGEFIACGAVLENRTLFDGVELLPPASAWTFRNATLETRSNYFHAREWEQQEALDAETFYHEFRDAFSRNLPRYFSGEEPVAMSLTGGLDTRMIMAWQRSQRGALPCYTFGSMLRENHDVRVARRVANACKQPFEVITAGEQFLSRFSHYAERAVYLSDGCVDVDRSPDVFVNEEARKIAPVRLTGNYGGEVLRGVRTFKPEEPLTGLFAGEILPQIRQAGNTFSELAKGHPVSFALFKQCPWNHYGILAIEQSQLSLRSPFLDNDLLRTVYRAPGAALERNAISLRLIADGNRELLDIPTDRGVAGDRSSFMSFIQRGLLEFQFKAEYAYDMGMPQWLSRMDHALSAFHLERLFLGRHKVFHFRIWYRDALASYVREVLLDPRSLARPYIQRKGLEQIVCGHLKGDRNYTSPIHKVLTLELVHRLFLDDSGSHRFREQISCGVPVGAKDGY